jgi:hypothetical protein
VIRGGAGVTCRLVLSPPAGQRHELLSRRSDRDSSGLIRSVEREASRHTVLQRDQCIGHAAQGGETQQIKHRPLGEKALAKAPGARAIRRRPAVFERGDFGTAVRYSQGLPDQCACELLSIEREDNIDAGRCWFLFTESSASPVVVRVPGVVAYTPLPLRGARAGECGSDNIPTSERRDSVARPKNTPIDDPADRHKQLTHFTGSCDSRL